MQVQEEGLTMVLLAQQAFAKRKRETREERKKNGQNRMLLHGKITLMFS